MSKYNERELQRLIEDERRSIDSFLAGHPDDSFALSIMLAGSAIKIENAPARIAALEAKARRGCDDQG